MELPGGDRSPVAALLTVKVSRTLRCAPFFEHSIALPTDLRRNEMVNSPIPAAGSERFKDRLFRFRYGPLGDPRALGTTGVITRDGGGGLIHHSGLLPWD